MIDDDDPGFDPDEVEEIERMMDAIMEEESVGYQMVFWISTSAAKELLDCYDNYRLGSYQDAILLMMEFAKIIEQLRIAMGSNEEDI